MHDFGISPLFAGIRTRIRIRDFKRYWNQNQNRNQGIWSWNRNQESEMEPESRFQGWNRNGISGLLAGIGIGTGIRLLNFPGIRIGTGIKMYPELCITGKHQLHVMEVLPLECFIVYISTKIIIN